MATPSISYDNLSCCLCMDIFKKPRVLNCGHSYCSKCLQDYISHNYDNNDSQITCPFCRQDVHIPDSTKLVYTWADHLPINKSLQDAANDWLEPKFSKQGGHFSLLSSVCESLKSYKEILQREIDDKIEQLRQAVDINVVDTTEEVRTIGDTLITDFTAAVHKEQERLTREIEKSQNFINSEIEKLFTEHKYLIEENEKMIKLGKDLLQRESESDIKTNISKFNKLQNTTSEFLSKSLSQIEKAEIKINLIKSDKKNIYVHIGEISTNIQTDTQIERQTDTLKHTGTINTKTQEDKENPILFSMLVPGEDKSQIVVSDYWNESVKCFCLERKSLIKRHVTSSYPCSLAESRDQRGDVVVVVTLPGENKILFLNLKNLKLIKTVKTTKRYKFIAVLPDNHLAVTGGHIGQYLDILTDTGQYLDILTESGQLINSISGDLIPEPSCLTVHDQCIIVVSNRENVNSLFGVTSSGDVKWESRDSDRLKKLLDVTCDMEGNIFACSENRNCVVQLSRDGNIIRDILTDRDGLSKPECVCCDDNKIYVGDLHGQIQIFTWCKK